MSETLVCAGGETPRHTLTTAFASRPRGVAYDIGSSVDAPPGLRLWDVATVEARDLDALTPWLDWAYAQVRQS